MFAIPVRPVLVMAKAKTPERTRALTKKLRNAIQHAQLICANHEDTRECHIAWDQVEELARTLHRVTLREIEQARLEALDPEPFSELEKRFYDL